MNMPRQVQRAADEAARLQSQLNTPPAESPEGTPPAAEAPPANPPSDQPPATPAAPALTVEQLQAELAKSEHRYRSLQGVFDAERHRMRDQMDQMQALIADLKAVPPAQPAAPAPVASQKDVDDFGEDTLDMVRRIATAVAREVVSEAVKSLVPQHIAPVAQRVEEVQARVARSAEEDFFDDLVGEVPDWEAVNMDPRFGQWLQTADAVTGVPYQTLLNDARARLDVRRVVAIFSRFKEIAGIAKPTPAPQRQQPVDERVTLVEPARRSSASQRPANGAEKRRWTRAQIGEFYRDVRTGKIAKADAGAIEADILLAQSEGRIVG